MRSRRRFVFFLLTSITTLIVVFLKQGFDLSSQNFEHKFTQDFNPYRDSGNVGAEDNHISDEENHINDEENHINDEENHINDEENHINDEETHIIDEDNHSSKTRPPSVFQQWLAQQPKRLKQSVDVDCRHPTASSAAVTSCRHRLRHVRYYCDKRMAEEEKQEGGGEEGFSDSNNPTVNDSVVDVFSYRNGHTVALYCSVHKVASTFWLRLFRFLHHDTGPGGEVAVPEALSKFQVHLTPFSQASRPYALAYLSRSMLQPGDEEFRFMFTREPYQRLWAVYIDKFVLPDYYFWYFHASGIKEMAYSRAGDTPVKLDQVEKESNIINNSTQQQKPEDKQPLDACQGTEVTFEDFVRYAVQDQTAPTAHRDDHIMPVSRTCNPCAFQPHFLGRFEHMEDDADIVMRKIGLGGKEYSKKKTFHERVLSQIRTVTDFAFDTVVRRRSLRHCISDEEMQGRLIRAFILNGYLPPEVAEVRRSLPTAAVSQLVNMMTELFVTSNRTQEEVEAQKMKFFVSDFSLLPLELREQVRDYYTEDFDAFGYDREPPELLFPPHEQYLYGESQGL